MQKKKLNLSIKILIGLAIGIVVGLFLPAEIANTWIKPFGTLFLNLIKMVVVPLVFSGPSGGQDHPVLPVYYRLGRHHRSGVRQPLPRGPESGL